MQTKSHLVRQVVRRRFALIAAIMATSALMMSSGAQTQAAGLGRALNPQPLPPGLYAPNHFSPIRSATMTSFPARFSRQLCVAWARVCVKVAPSPPTREGPCEQYEYVCRKYG